MDVAATTQWKIPATAAGAYGVTLSPALADAATDTDAAAAADLRDL